MMDAILRRRLRRDEAGLWFLGQAGYVVRGCGTTVVIDPYLSDSAGKGAKGFSRAFPTPIAPEDLRADVFIVTHDHLDHLDPETVGPYRHKETTAFVAPRLACRKLRALGVPERSIVKVDSGETAEVAGVKVTGVYAVPTQPDAIDTAGYRIEFANGRSVYHTSDTGFSELLVRCVPRAEVLLACINGKWGNLDVHEAVRVAGGVKPRYAVPNHYDVMPLNSENPETFAFFLGRAHPGIEVRILEVMKAFVWGR